MPDEVPWIDPIVVPDDLRDLQADVEAYHRERRLASRRRRIERITRSHAWQRFAMPVAVVAASVGTATIVFAVLVIGTPRPQPGPVQFPVAAHPAAAVGAVHGLLPPVRLATHTTPLPVRAERPAVFALVPQPCRCDTVLTHLAAEADEVHVPLVVVAPSAADAEIDALAGRVHAGRLIPAYDAAAVLAGTYHPRGVTALVVGPDATVYSRVDDVKATDLLGPALAQLLSPAPAVSQR